MAANTITQRTLVGVGSDRNIYRLIHLVSVDGTEETDTVIYDNSTLVANVLKGSLKQVWLSGNSCTVRLEWDQSTDSIAFQGDPINGGHWDFRGFGGIVNPGATGATGDLVMTTGGLDTGDEFWLIIHIVQD